MDIGLIDVVIASLTIAGYTLGACYFFYRLNDKAIERSNQRHENSINEWRVEHSKQIEKNESHWREMFTHFNNRMDRINEAK